VVNVVVVVVVVVVVFVACLLHVDNRSMDNDSGKPQIEVGRVPGKGDGVP
jgi:hypothetical protein